jgi:hypothetical protein
LNKDEIFDAIEDAHEGFLDAIEGLSDEQMQEPGVVGDWSIKDILHHLNMWKGEMVRLLWQISQGEKPGTVHFSERSMDETNAAWFQQGKDRPLEKALDDFAAVHKQAMRRVDAVPDKLLEDPQHFPWSKGEALWQWIAADSFQHEDEHAQQIRAWREQRGY